MQICAIVIVDVRSGVKDCLVLCCFISPSILQSILSTSLFLSISEACRRLRLCCCVWDSGLKIFTRISALTDFMLSVVHHQDRSSTLCLLNKKCDLQHSLFPGKFNCTTVCFRSIDLCVFNPFVHNAEQSFRSL